MHASSCGWAWTLPSTELKWSVCRTVGAVQVDATRVCAVVAMEHAVWIEIRHDLEHCSPTPATTVCVPSHSHVGELSSRAFLLFNSGRVGNEKSLVDTEALTTK